MDAGDWLFISGVSVYVALVVGMITATTRRRRRRLREYHFYEPWVLSREKLLNLYEMMGKRAPFLKAEQLLVRHLDSEQLAQYSAHGYIDVTGSRKGRYRIWMGTLMTVGKLDRQGKPAVSLCIQPSDPRIPPPDSMLAIKLLIETDERTFRKVAV